MPPHATLSELIANRLSLVHDYSRAVTSGRRNILVSLAGATALAVILPLLWRTLTRPTSRPETDRSAVKTDARESDPSILKKHSSLRSFHVPATGFVYPGVRIVYRDHPQSDKLPSKPSPLPLLVFIHGLGGSAAQFAPLLTSLVNIGPCLCIDLPGCGMSDFAPEAWEAYTQTALTALLAVIIDTYRDVGNAQSVILIAHSMGCSLSARLAGGEPSSALATHVSGVVALCPQASDMSESRSRALRRLTDIPTILFDMLRSLDRVGGVNSSSVRRFVGPNAATRTKTLQYRFNAQSKTDVFRRMARGAIPITVGESSTGGLANYAIWDQIDVPILLIGGESDNLTLPKETRDLASRLVNSKGTLSEHSQSHFDGAAGDRRPIRGVRLAILPKPASHALLFAPEQCRVVSGLIQSFLADSIDKRLSFGWQLQYLSKEGKWDVKNLEKWRKVEQTSAPIGGIFMAMKTMREVDDMHNPTVFAERWRDQIKAIIDISHEAPVYDPKKLEAGGIEYHKFPTVSKLPPSPEEVQHFEEMVDSIRDADPGKHVIAVHCHYGFNRTGYFIICYLVDRLGWSLEDAIKHFAEKRHPGVKHQHFIDELYVRYCLGLNSFM